MELRALLNLYFDFYGSLLTEKQQKIFKLYFEDDLSLAEIAEEIGVTRQAVHDILQRSEKQLQYYEQKLELVDRFLKQKEKISTAYALLNNEVSNINVENALKLLQEVILDEA